MTDRPGRSSDSTDSLQWRADFGEAFEALFKELAAIPPGNWTWRFDYSHLLSVTVISRNAGRLVSVNLPDGWRKMAPQAAAQKVAETLRERMAE